MIPDPRFCVLAELATNPRGAVGRTHHQPTDKAEFRTLQAAFDGDLNPADDLLADAGNEGGLPICDRGEPVKPFRNLIGSSFITKLGT